jgi:hypothetical protein
LGASERLDHHGILSPPQSNPIMTAPLPLPKIDTAGRSALHDFLAESVAKRNIPALFLGVTSAAEVIYADQAGERVFGDETAGHVDENTGIGIYFTAYGVLIWAVLQIFSTSKLVTTVSCGSPGTMSIC